jgi:hypothetical protein
LERAEIEDDVAAARHLVGVSLHAVQDFYSHSTWLDSPDLRAHTWLSTWSRTRKAESVRVPHDLVTGGFALNDGANPPHGETSPTAAALLRFPALLAEPLLGSLTSALRLPRGVKGGKLEGINLDSRWQAPTGAAHRRSDLTPNALFELAYDLALTESRLWLTLLAAHMGDAFWSRVVAAPAERWTKAFERPTGGLYDLMTAGQYPPRDKRDSHSWFLHVTPRDPRRPLIVEISNNNTWFGKQGHPGRAVTIGPTHNGAQLKIDGGRAQVVAFRRAPTPAWHIVPGSVVNLPEE